MKRTKTKRSSINRFEALSDARKIAAIAEFDIEFIAEKSRPLVVAERRDWNKFRKMVDHDANAVGLRNACTTAKLATGTHSR